MPSAILNGQLESPVSGSEDQHARIIEAATGLFEHGGFRQTGVDAIAARARVSKRTIYECFADKHAILEAVLANFSDRQFRRTADSSAGTSPPRQRLRQIVTAFQQAAQDQHAVAMVRLLISEMDSLPGMAIRMARRAKASTLALVGPVLKELGLKESSSEAIAALIYDLAVMAPMLRCLTHADDHPWDAAGRLDVLLDGLLANSGK